MIFGTDQGLSYKKKDAFQKRLSFLQLINSPPVFGGTSCIIIVTKQIYIY